MVLPQLISVVIPVYRAERILPALCDRLTAALSALTSAYEIVLIDDRSPDRCWEILQEMTRAHPNIVAVRLSRNFGQHYAITAGLDVVEGEWTVIMDCDLQDQPEEIGRLLAKAQEGYDIVLARRHTGDDYRQKWSSRLFYRLFNLLSGYRMDPSVGTFRIMRRPVVDAYRKMRETGRLFGGMVEWLGFETGFVDTPHAERAEGRSSYNFRSLCKLALDGIFAFSNRPLYFSIGIGVAVSLAAACFGFTLVVHYLLDPHFALPGWASEITVTAFIGGLILMNLGIVGVYIGRIHDQTKSRPLYVVDRVISSNCKVAATALRSSSYMKGLKDY
jgi:dolichol-phosphate mannosyltransferase